MNQTIGRICEQFESAWHQGEPLSIESALQQSDGELRESLCVELLKLEVTLRQAAGESPQVEEYEQRFPKFREAIQSALVESGLMDETVDLKSQFADETTSYPSAADGNPLLREGALDGLPKSIGRYTVIGTLGRGGQADVYRAVHPTLPLEVAIKLSHKAVSMRARQALREEAHILCELDHPYIARIRDLDFDDYRPFLVLDFIRGRSLGQIVTAGPLAAEAAAEVVAKVARAIEYAHARGIIHRDLKPDNIVIDPQGEPKIIDFGMSRLRSGFAGEIQDDHEVSGTFAYMAPEQAEGVVSKTDHRVDIFALGAILYRLLVGRPPYTPLPLKTMLPIVRQGEWDKQALAEAQGPEELKAICLRALSKNPSQRYATAGMMADAITEFVDSQRVASSLQVPPTDATQNRAKLTSIALISCLIIAFIAVAYLVDLMRFRPAVQVTDNEQAADVSLHPAIATDLIQDFSVIHIGNTGDQATFAGPLFEHRQPRENDNIQVRAKFHQPVYCFLVALNPNGVKQLCYPHDPTIAQASPIPSLRYPEDEESAFGLTDGAGQQAFVLYASATPLPAFDDWDSELTSTHWPNPSMVGNWEYEVGQLESRSYPVHRGSSVRGAERKTKVPGSFKDLCDRLRQARTSDARGIVFEIAAGVPAERTPDHQKLEELYRRLVVDVTPTRGIVSNDLMRHLDASPSNENEWNRIRDIARNNEIELEGILQLLKDVDSSFIAERPESFATIAEILRQKQSLYSRLLIIRHEDFEQNIGEVTEIKNEYSKLLTRLKSCTKELKEYLY